VCFPSIFSGNPLLHASGTVYGEAWAFRLPRQSAPQHLLETEGEMAETHKVTINTMAFNPASITISNGDTVEWTNQMAFDHTVTADNNEFPNSGNIKPQATFSYTFSATGSVTYHCQIHPFMKGTVTVT
jgi:plastocyanin